MRPTRLGAPHITIRMRGDSDDHPADQAGMKVFDPGTSRGQMDSMRSGSARDVGSSVDQDPAARSFGQRQRRLRQLEECAIRKVLFADLNEIHAPTDRAINAVEQFQVRQLCSVGDITKKRTLNGEENRRSFS